jgi:hypothetical protein
MGVRGPGAQWLSEEEAIVAAAGSLQDAEHVVQKTFLRALA